jgi:hypothetical protein
MEVTISAVMRDIIAISRMWLAHGRDFFGLAAESLLQL